MESSDRLVSLLRKVVDGGDLNLEESKTCAEIIMEGKVPPEIVSALLVALRMKGEASDEIAGFAYKMIEKALKPEISFDVVDTCGTGGDLAHTFNASTASAIVLSSMGFPIAKHGNRAVSSAVGSADILEKIGVKIDSKPDEIKSELESKNFVFLFAPLYHPAMKNVAPIRRQLGIRTIFNFLGPITNPLRPKAQLIGVMSKEVARKIAQAILVLGSPKKAFLVVGSIDGSENKIDEVSVCGDTLFIEIDGSSIRSEFTVSPSDFGAKKVSIESLRYKDPVSDFVDTLSGKGREELVDFVSVNVASALYLLGKVKSFSEGFEVSKNFIISQKVVPHLSKLRGLS
ncbi:MAG: anthranilate phosphoribosyltransferase [Candidatus Calescibacterium sp.]|nr:anthranilate phosphoribosyltransferase [Candidatus Calescibacterium sp.]MDW8087852.1 anthranilate phosphoribosyltransferase [Candidatus Calescibacterium sp.]